MNKLPTFIALGSKLLSKAYHLKLKEKKLSIKKHYQHSLENSTLEDVSKDIEIKQLEHLKDKLLGE